MRSHDHCRNVYIFVLGFITLNFMRLFEDKKSSFFFITHFSIEKKKSTSLCTKLAGMHGYDFLIMFFFVVVIIMVSKTKPKKNI